MKIRFSFGRQILNKKENEAFTLIELVVVVAVLAILAGIASSSFNRFRITVDENEAKVLASNIIKSMAVYDSINGSLPTSWTQMSEEYFPDLRYCLYDNAISRSCGTGVGMPVSSINAAINPMNCIVVTQASYELCGEINTSSFRMVLREMSEINSPSERQSISACYSRLEGGRVVKQSTRDAVWINCNSNDAKNEGCAGVVSDGGVCVEDAGAGG